MDDAWLSELFEDLEDGTNKTCKWGAGSFSSPLTQSARSIIGPSICHPFGSENLIVHDSSAVHDALSASSSGMA